MIFRQSGELTARQPQFAAEDFRVVLADQRCPSRDPPRRAVIDGPFRRRTRRRALRGWTPTSLRQFPEYVDRLVGLAGGFDAGVFDSLNGAFCTLHRPSAGCSISRYISRWRS